MPGKDSGDLSGTYLSIANAGQANSLCSFVNLVTCPVINQKAGNLNSDYYFN